MAKLFRFVQFDFAGKLPLADGRYLANGEETVLVLELVGAPPAPPRRRRRPRAGSPQPEPAPVALKRVTVIRASSPFESQAEAARWLDQVCEDENEVEALAEEAIAPLNQALHTHAVVAADPRGSALAPEAAERVLIGYGSGEETADGRFTDARQVDLATRASPRRRRREEELRPQERMAAVLRGREQLDACETLLLRARGDLDAGRDREAALQLRVGLEALLVELEGAVDDPGHEKDLAALREAEAGTKAAAEAATRGDITDEQHARVEEATEIAERVLRRRRVFRG